ncbi:MAG: GntR family transcriptional regulator [Actinomycetota bacterium]|nr:GntR family transcriptional regulator [Actinomycetota bacterium]
MSDPDPLGTFDGRETLSDRLYAHLETAIIDGAIRPGERIHADEVAERFRVSRIPVREAFRALAAEGWLEIRPRRETVVASRSERELRELAHARRVLGAEVAGLAALNRTDHDLVVLDRLVEENGELLDAGELAALSRNNEAFHVAIAVAGHNRVLEDLVRRTEKRNRWYFEASLPPDGPVTTREHRELIEAIRAGSTERATAIATRHLARTPRPAADLGLDAVH